MLSRVVRIRWIRRQALLAGLFLTAALSQTFAADPSTLAQLDQRFQLRDDVQQLRQLVEDVDKLNASFPGDYELTWRAAKYKYYFSDVQPEKARRIQLLKEGVELAKKAVQQNSGRAEGHFWLTANYGKLTELQGPFSSLWKVGTIRKGFETVLKLDPIYNNGSVYLALGEMFLRLPGILGGNDSKGIALLETGAKVAPHNHDLNCTLAKVYLEELRKTEARQLLERVLETDDPLMSKKELAQIRSRASQLLDPVK